MKAKAQSNSILASKAAASGRPALSIHKSSMAPVRNLSLPRRELFSTAEVMEWMRRRSRADISAEELELFRTVADVNAALEVRRSGANPNIGRLVGRLEKGGRESNGAVSSGKR